MIALRRLPAVVLFAAAVAAQTETPKPAAARTYPAHALEQWAKVDKGADGKPKVELNVTRFTTLVEDLWACARDYPPTFADKKEQELAKAEATKAGELLVILDLAKQEKPSIDLLLLAARLEAAAHNLDVRGAADRAITYYERVLALQPDHAQASFLYGCFLAGTATGQAKAVPHLEKALQLGEERARFSLGLCLLMQGDKAKAREHIAAWSKANPDDFKAKALLKVIDSGGEVVRRTNGKPDAPAPAKTPPPGRQDG